MNNHEIKVIITDDHALFADGLEQIIASIPSMKVIGKLMDGKSLLHHLNNNLPDLILMDINMPILDGFNAAKSIIKSHPSIKIIFISMHFDEKLIEKSMELGVHGYLLKDITAPDLKIAIKKVIEGEKVFSKNECQLLHYVDNNSQNFLSIHKITDREYQIIELIMEGLASKQIAANLELSTYTVETHRKNIHRKLQVQSTAELIAKFHRLKQTIL